jgi:hypothetical protein
LRVPVYVLLHRHEVGKKGLWLPASGGMVLYTAGHDRGSQRFPAAIQVFERVPVNGTNAVIEVEGGIFIDEICNVDDAQELLTGLRMNPEIYAEQGVDGDGAASLFKSLANDGLLGRLARFDMTARLRNYNDA